MRILHTSDWHLGHTLHDMPREYEHDRFLAWLLDLLADTGCDALVVAGDVFDTANPPAAAQAAYYRFLAQARARVPHLDVVVIGGNHDSAQRLDAPHPILEGIGIRVVGGHPHDVERLLVPLRRRGGDVAAWLAAVPFLRTSDLPVVDAEDPLIEGVRAVYAEALQAARARMNPNHALLAAGHCYMVGTALSEMSERKILGGNQHALPSDIFPGDVAYAALGHLHLAQSVGGRDGVRYSGSPIPLSMAEIDYPHQVVLVDLEGAELKNVTAVAVPRVVDLMRLPFDEPVPISQLLPMLANLPDACGDARAWPYLEVRVLLEQPEPSLRERVQDALEGKAVRLVAIHPFYAGTRRALAEAVPGLDLRTLVPERVFLERYARSYDGPPPDALLAAFHELVEVLV